ncbi:MAG: sugar phosphate isomerase/epimerase family protein [Phycisphaerae bacterium]|jgi:sugar phosphate isomerase/epimerase
MYLTGFADEAAKGIDGQIRATKELGWKYIEARNINDKNIIDIPNAEFDIVVKKLENAGIKINCFGSTIANWAKQIIDSDETSFEEVKRAIPRMQRLGTKLIRIMSYAVLEDREPDDQMEKKRFEQLRLFVKTFSDAGITAVHENCMNYGGMGWRYTIRLIENVPGLRLVFDTGNPVFNYDRSKPKPWHKQSSFEFYKNVKDYISYIHIKDGVWDEKEKKSKFTFPGEGDGDVFKIVKDLLDTGYNGGFSIEPHMSVVLHDNSIVASEENKYTNYIEYGHRFEKLVEKAKRVKT